MSRDDPERTDGDGFLSAWSRRKLAARREETRQRRGDAEPEAPPEDDPAPERAAPAEPDAPEVDAAYLDALPPIDEITAKTDLGPFMKPGVPTSLRNAAMRKMWMTNALIRDLDDPAVDYAWDWNSAEGVPGAGEMLNRDNVAKMVDDLVNKGTPSEDAPEEIADTDAAESEDGPEAAEEHAAAAAQEAPDGKKTGKFPTGENKAEGPGTADGPEIASAAPMSEKTPRSLQHRPAPRRHGGALPE